MKTVTDILDEAGVNRLHLKIVEMINSGTIVPHNRRPASSGEPLSLSAVTKWHKNGIPEVYWPAVRSLTGVSTEELHRANLALHAERSRTYKKAG